LTKEEGGRVHERRSGCGSVYGALALRRAFLSPVDEDENEDEEEEE
jgi:hypothetical protein